jgi:hypothetical protein
VDPLALRTLALVNIASPIRGEDAMLEHVRGLMPAPVYDATPFSSIRGSCSPATTTRPAQDNLPGRIEDGWVVGLGATDMKGGLAHDRARARRRPFGYLFFGREELPAGESAAGILRAHGWTRSSSSCSSRPTTRFRSAVWAT